MVVFWGDKISRRLTILLITQAFLHGVFLEDIIDILKFKIAEEETTPNTIFSIYDPRFPLTLWETPIFMEEKPAQL